jgi:hypothetical protein
VRVFRFLLPASLRLPPLSLVSRILRDLAQGDARAPAGFERGRRLASKLLFAKVRKRSAAKPRRPALYARASQTTETGRSCRPSVLAIADENQDRDIRNQLIEMNDEEPRLEPRQHQKAENLHNGQRGNVATRLSECGETSFVRNRNGSRKFLPIHGSLHPWPFLFALGGSLNSRPIRSSCPAMPWGVRT